MKLPAKIGAVEFDDDEIRLAVVNTGGRVPSILDVSVCRAVYESASERFEALVAAVKHARAQLKAKPSAWVVCAGSDNAIARKLVLPFKGRGKVAAAVPFELEPYLAFPIDELAVDYSIIREADGNTEVLAVGVRRTLLEEQLDVLSAGGITAEGIGLDAAGLSSLLRACQGGTAGLTAALHAREYGGIAGGHARHGTGLLAASALDQRAAASGAGGRRAGSPEHVAGVPGVLARGRGRVV